MYNYNDCKFHVRCPVCGQCHNCNRRFNESLDRYEEQANAPKQSGTKNVVVQLKAKAEKAEPTVHQTAIPAGPSNDGGVDNPNPGWPVRFSPWRDRFSSWYNNLGY